MVEKSTAHLQGIVTKVHTLSTQLHQTLNHDIKASTLQRPSNINDFSNLHHATELIENSHDLLKKIQLLKNKMSEYEVSWSKTKLASLQKENVETTWAVASTNLTNQINQSSSVMHKNLLHAYELLEHYSPESIESQLAAGTTETEVRRSWQTNQYIFTELLREPIQACVELQDKAKGTLEFLSK